MQSAITNARYFCFLMINIHPLAIALISFHVVMKTPRLEPNQPCLKCWMLRYHSNMDKTGWMVMLKLSHTNG